MLARFHQRGNLVPQLRLESLYHGNADWRKADRMIDAGQRSREPGIASNPAAETRRMDKARRSFGTPICLDSTKSLTWNEMEPEPAVIEAFPVGW